ncbi:MAG: hypothetical protein OXU42_19150 [Deltaproteobacteria bacterium]|nr:hypothetical protein [Deltaproteobacteria bacterium]
MNRSLSDDHGTTGAEAKRWPHSIRFLEHEWERIAVFAEARGFTAPEFVRFAALTAVADEGNSAARLAPLIERTFRATYILATRLRNEMLDAGEQEELEEMIAAARGLQDELLNGASD